ncbi:hypothetical protein [Comamonas denitrificans]|uniref:hypothetical protein n=1 Tax=Comamonas denitrificans TaxID=117506 RepID=UPI0011AF99F6
MKYLVKYQYTNLDAPSDVEFEIETTEIPDITNKYFIDAARKDSVKNIKSGLFSIKLTSIKLISEK